MSAPTRTSTRPASWATTCPWGPLKLADAIGIDVMIEVMESLYQETADSKYRPAHLYKVLYRAGRLGRKSGKGFYDYTK